MRFWKYTYTVLVFLAAFLWLAVFQLPDANLHIIACDVGQGDAILAVYKNIQILTDGGIPNGRVIDCLSRHMPFWDREIEAVVNTHPQLDHYGGLIEVFKKYKVDYFIGNGLDASASEYQVLKKEVGGRGASVINPVTGTIIRSGLMSYDIFWPSFAFLASEGIPYPENKLSTFVSKRDPNDFSVQAILSLGKFDSLLTGDIGENMSDQVIKEFTLSTSRRVEYIKVPHHGSKYGLTPDYIKAIVAKEGLAPIMAVISAGKNNRYGHPTRLILDLLKTYGIKTFRTDLDGETEVVTDGKRYWITKNYWITK